MFSNPTTNLVPEVASTAKAPGAEIEELIQSALNESGFPVQKVQCRCDAETVILTGKVGCYFHVQMALAAALRFSAHRLIINRIEVVPRGD